MIGAAGYLPASVRARSSGARACRSVSARRIGEGPFNRSPSTSVRTAAATSAGGPLTCRAATGARPDGAPVPSAPASASGAAAAAPGTSAAARALARHSSASPRRTSITRSGPSIETQRQRKRASRSSGASKKPFSGGKLAVDAAAVAAAAPSAASHRSGRTHGTAATCQRRRLLDGVAPPVIAGEHVEHRPGALRSAVETADQHQPPLVGHGRDGRLERANAAPRRGQADGLDD